MSCELQRRPLLWWADLRSPRPRDELRFRIRALQNLRFVGTPVCFFPAPAIQIPKTTAWKHRKSGIPCLFGGPSLAVCNYKSRRQPPWKHRKSGIPCLFGGPSLAVCMAGAGKKHTGGGDLGNPPYIRDEFIARFHRCYAGPSWWISGVSGSSGCSPGALLVPC